MIKFVKRDGISRISNIFIRIAAIILSLLVVGIFLLTMNLDALKVYSAMLNGAFGNLNSIRQTIVVAIPLVITALGISVAFRMQFWNIGGEGQIIMGAFAASLIAYSFPDLSSPVLITIMAIAGLAGGGLWALLPGIFKAYYRTNETIVTLMLNYVALQWISYLQTGPWKDKKALGFAKMPNFSDNAILPDVFGVHAGWIIALILTAVIFVLMKYSKKGYEIAVIGESEKTALYAGISIRKTVIFAVVVSGALCGLAGMIQASGVLQNLSTQVSGGYGYTAIIVAWLSSLSAPLILVVSILFAALLQGGSYIQVAFGIPQSAALVLQSTILFFVLGSEFFVKYKLVRKGAL